MAADPVHPARHHLRLAAIGHRRRYLPLISPTPLLMVLAPNDRLAAGEIACAAYETAAHPKKIQIVPGGHFDTYTGPGFEISSGAACDWFTEHLLAKA